VSFLNGSIHRTQPQTESETAAPAGPLGGFEYVDSRRAGSDLTPADYAALESRWIDPETARRAGLRRVDSLTGGEIVGRRGIGDYSGILIPYLLPGTDQLRDYRLRRDRPDLEYDAGGSLKAKRKYLSPPGRSNMLYLPPGVSQSLLGDPMLPIAITAGEFKTLALWRAAHHRALSRPRFLPLGVSGIYNWQGTIGKTIGPYGSRMDVKGAIPDLDWVAWAGRPVVIAYDADAVTKELVRIARSALAAHLRGRGALVGFLEWNIERGKGIDDHLAAVGPDMVLDEIAHVDPAGSVWRKDLLRSKPAMNTTEGHLGRCANLPAGRESRLLPDSRRTAVHSSILTIRVEFGGVGPAALTRLQHWCNEIPDESRTEANYSSGFVSA